MGRPGHRGEGVGLKISDKLRQGRRGDLPENGRPKSYIKSFVILTARCTVHARVHFPEHQKPEQTITLSRMLSRSIPHIVETRKKFSLI